MGVIYSNKPPVPRYKNKEEETNITIIEIDKGEFIVKCNSLSDTVKFKEFVDENNLKVKSISKELY